MAVFVFGAGATRGCHFVNSEKDSCLPPTDADFFTQLQRVQNKKHRKDIQAVMADVVELFGTNFSVSMETVFTTIEHAIRMVAMMGDNRHFNKKELEAKRERLKQAIAFVFEDSLTSRKDDGSSSLKPHPCKHHQRFVEKILGKRDILVGFNYDCVLDYALKDHGRGKWNAHFGYGFNLGSHGHKLKGDSVWQPKLKGRPVTKKGSVRYLKLHGSLHFDFDPEDETSIIKLKARPYTKQGGDMHFAIIPPEWNKTFDKGHFASLWKKAAAAISDTRELIIIGYSMPATDLHASSLFRTSISRSKKLRALVVVNPDKEARKRVRTVVQAGLDLQTKVLSFDSFAEFVNTPRGVWTV